MYIAGGIGDDLDVVNNGSDQSARAREAGSGARRGVHVIPAKAQFLRQDEALVKRGTAIDLARRANPAHGRRCERYLDIGWRWR
jgi:hypothetical protein